MISLPKRFTQMFDKDGYLKSDTDFGTFYDRLWKHSCEEEIRILQKEVAEKFKDVNFVVAKAPEKSKQVDITTYCSKETLVNNADIILGIATQEEKSAELKCYVIKNKDDKPTQDRQVLSKEKKANAFRLSPGDKEVIVRLKPKSFCEETCEEIHEELDREVFRAIFNGMYCGKCNTLHHYVEQGNQSDGSYLCYECIPGEDKKYIYIKNWESLGVSSFEEMEQKYPNWKKEFIFCLFKVVGFGKGFINFIVLDSSDSRFPSIGRTFVLTHKDFNSKKMQIKRVIE